MTVKKTFSETYNVSLCLRSVPNGYNQLRNIFSFQTHKQPVTEYEAIREKAASQKRDIERALTKFLAKTSETHNLFNTEDNQVFPCKYSLLVIIILINFIGTL